MALALLCSLSLVSLGCSDEEDSSFGRPVRLLLPRAPERLDPRFVSEAYGLKVSRLIFASLVTLHPLDLQVVPDLAQEVTVVSPTRYRVRLKPSLRFSDGSPLDAQDVVATYRGIADPDLGSRYAGSYSRIRSVRALSPLEVEFELEEPHAPFLTDLELPIVRKEDAWRPMGAGAAPLVGAGPYRLASRTESRLELEPNPHWYRGKPKYARVDLRIVKDDNTRTMRMVADKGELVVNAIPPLLLPLLEEDGRYAIQSVAGVSTTYLGFNLRVAALADSRVRRAIAFGIDRDALIAAKYDGRARKAMGWVPPGHWAYDASVPRYPFDPARARRLLETAGYDSSSPLRAGMRVPSDRHAQSIARAIKAMLREVGVEVSLRPSEMATLLADLKAGRFDMTLMQIPEVLEPHVMSWFFRSDRVPGPGREGANRWAYRNEALDRAFERGRLTSDLRDRRAAYATVQRLLAEDLPVIPLWHEDTVAVMSEELRDFQVPRDGRLQTLAREFE